VFAINPSGNNLGCINWGIRTLDGEPNVRREQRNFGLTPDAYVLNRNLWIEVENQPDPLDPVNVRMFVLTSEVQDLMDDLQNDGFLGGMSFSDFLDDSLRITKFDSTVIDLDIDNNRAVDGGTREVLNPGNLPYRSAINGHYLDFSVTSFSEFIPFYIPDAPNTPLPIELLYFRGELVESEVVLDWATSVEINNDYFVVERSADGNVFEEIMEIEGAGDSKVRLNYQEIDTEPLQGVSYYRLKQVDFDGKFTYSRVVSVNLELAKSIELFPNPAKSTFHLKFNGYELNSKVAVQFYSASGKDLGIRTFTIGQNRTIDFDSDQFGMTTGMYTLEIMLNNKVIVKKLVVK
jgi:hypothetical protein